jgi:hypothetical protein
MQEMKYELAAILSALAAIGVQKKGGKPKPQGGAPPRGARKQPTGSTAGGAGTGRSTSDALGPVYAHDWIKCYMCRQKGVQGRIGALENATLANSSCPNRFRSKRRENRLCTAIHGSALGIWDSACTVDEHSQVVVAIVNMTNDKFELVSGDCVGSMSNSVFEADGGIYKLNDESVNTIFGNIGKVPEDPKWGKGPPIEPKEKKVLKTRLQVLAEEPWRQQYINLMLRYQDVCSKDKFDLGCADMIEHSIFMEDERPVHQRQF